MGSISRTFFINFLFSFISVFIVLSSQKEKRNNKIKNLSSMTITRTILSIVLFVLMLPTFDGELKQAWIF
jgi:hypothetical protein